MVLFISSITRAINLLVASFFSLYWRIELFSFLFIYLFVFQNLATKTNLDNAAKTTPSTTQPPILPHQTIAQKNSCTKMRQPAINRQRLLAVLSTSPSLKIACKITPIPTLLTRSVSLSALIQREAMVSSRLIQSRRALLSKSLLS